jgi:hypothetical protein
MDNSSFLNFLSAVLSALFTAIATVLAAYISKRGDKKNDTKNDDILKPPGYIPPRKSSKISWGKWLFFIFLSLVILTIIIRVALNIYFFAAVETKTVPFVSNNDPTVLNPNLEWEAGNSGTDAYHFEGYLAEITAGSYTWPNFPIIHYKPIIDGNFSVSVKMTFVPDAPVIKTAQMAGILVHPLNVHLVQSDDKFPSDWIAVSKNVTDSGSLVGCRGSWVDYYSDTVFLKIERVNNSWQCAYSSNGENWSYLKVSVNNAQLQNQQFVVSLFAYSGTDNAINVTFSDWEIDYEK